jgi:hypothetical protein
MKRLLPLLLLAACAGPQAPAPAGPRAAAPREGCTGQIFLRNASGQAIEQIYAGRPGDWGSELMPQGTLPPGAQGAFRLGVPPAGQRTGFRVVFVNGRAAELNGVDICETPAVTVLPDAMRAAAS